jgi:hypothetical protein
MERFVLEERGSTKAGGDKRMIRRGKKTVNGNERGL